MEAAVRVLGHELSNSLAPIKSIAGSLLARVDRDGAGMTRSCVIFGAGLGVVESRADSLHRFVQSYRLLAQLPPPHRKAVLLGPLLERVVLLEQRLKVELDEGPAVVLNADPDQLEQMLINLLANAVDASLANGSHPVHAGWNMAEADSAGDDRRQRHGDCEYGEFVCAVLYDEAIGEWGRACAGAADRAGAWGEITLVNREDGDGARATVRLPVG